MKNYLKEIQEATTLHALIELWNKIATNKKQYSIDELSKQKNLIKDKISTVNGHNREKWNFYLFIENLSSPVCDPELGWHIQEIDIIKYKSKKS